MAVTVAFQFPRFQFGNEGNQWKGLKCDGSFDFAQDRLRPPLHSRSLPPVIAIIKRDGPVRAEIDHAEAFRATVHRPLPVIAADGAAIDDMHAIWVKSFVKVQVSGKDRPDIVTGGVFDHRISIRADQIFRGGLMIAGYVAGK